MAPEQPQISGSAITSLYDLGMRALAVEKRIVRVQFLGN